MVGITATMQQKYQAFEVIIRDILDPIHDDVDCKVRVARYLVTQAAQCVIGFMLLCVMVVNVKDLIGWREV